MFYVTKCLPKIIVLNVGEIDYLLIVLARLYNEKPKFLLIKRSTLLQKVLFS